MAAVGLSDVFKYGTRFLAHLLVVVLLGVVLVLIGNEIGDFLVWTASDPDIRPNLGATAYAGIAIAVGGVLVTVAGLGGLLFKLVADGTAVGTQSVLADGLDDSIEDASADDEQAAGDTPTSDTPDTEPQGTGEGPADERPRQPQQPTETTAPSADQSEGPFSQDQPAASQEPDLGEPVSRQEPPSEQFDETVGQQSAESSETEQTSQTAREPSPPQSEQPDQSPEPDEGATTVGQSDEESNADEPPEWTPPDPAEFERQQSKNAEERAQQDTEDAVDRSSEDTSASPLDEHQQDSFDDDTRVVDEDQFDDSVGGATTWDDLQSPTPEPADDPVTEASQSTTGEDWGSPEQVADESEPRGEEESQTDDADEENSYEDESTSDEDDDSGFSFETSGDGDPLSDALDDN